MSWVRALFTIGARQMIACPSFTKLPIEMNLRPVSDSIGKITPPTTFGFSVEPSMTGMEEPWTSASSISTDFPARSSAAARLTATVLLPTPPLPETTAMMRVFDSSRKAGANSEGPPCRLVIRFWRSSSVITPKSTSTLSTPSIIINRSRTSVVMRCFIGQPAVVSATPTVTPEPWMSTLRIMFSETRSRPISGSRTSLNASLMPASENPSAGSWGWGVRSTSSSAVSAETSSASSLPASSGGRPLPALPARLRNQSTTSANLLRASARALESVHEKGPTNPPISGQYYHRPPRRRPDRGGPYPAPKRAKGRKSSGPSRDSYPGCPPLLADHLEAPVVGGRVSPVLRDDLGRVLAVGEPRRGVGEAVGIGVIGEAGPGLAVHREAYILFLEIGIGIRHRGGDVRRAVPGAATRRGARRGYPRL